MAKKSSKGKAPAKKAAPKPPTVLPRWTGTLIKGDIILLEKNDKKMYFVFHEWSADQKKKFIFMYPASDEKGTLKQPAVAVKMERMKLAVGFKFISNKLPEPKAAITPAATNLPARLSDEQLAEAKEKVLSIWTKASLDLEGINTIIDAMNEGKALEGISIPVALNGLELAELPQLESARAAQMQYIEALNRAVIRCENATYGVCAVSKQLIEPERLAEIPWATVCVKEVEGSVNLDDDLRPAIQSNRTPTNGKNELASTATLISDDQHNPDILPVVHDKVSEMKKVYGVSLKHEFTDVEKLLKADELAEATDYMNTLEEEKKTVVASYKNKIDGVQNTVNKLSKEIRTGWEMRSHSTLNRKLDFNEGKRLYYHPQSNELIGSEPLTAEDHQLAANFPEEEIEQK